MSLLKLPNEMIHEIGLYFLPNPPQLATKPFYLWADAIRSQGPSVISQSRDLLALGLSCKRIRDALPKIHHAHVRDFNVNHLISIYKDLKMNSLTVNNLCTGWSAQKQPVLLPAQLQDCPVNMRTSSSFIPSVVNKSLSTLYILDCAAFYTPLQWLVELLEELKVIYVEYQYYDSQCELNGQDLTVSDVLEVLENFAPNLEKLVLTQRGFTHSADPKLRIYSSLMKLTNLTSLSIGSFLLFGGEDDFDDKRAINKFLPPSLVEFEVLYDDGDCGHDYSFMGYRTGGVRPDWLFQLLQEKKEMESKIERVRIMSNCDWEPGMEYCEVWEQGIYQPCLGDWVKSDGNENWKPPMELIMAFEEARVSFGIWLHPKRRFKLVVTGGTWFNDSWEDSWSEKDMAIFAANVPDGVDEENLLEGEGTSSYLGSTMEEEDHEG